MLLLYPAIEIVDELHEAYGSQEDIPEDGVFNMNILFPVK